MDKLTGNYDEDIKLAENYLQVESDRVKLQSIDVGFVGDGGIRFNYNICDENGHYQKTVSVFPQFEDEGLATDKIRAELKK